MKTSQTSKTELVFILDKSGSMSGLESDTIGGYNAMLKKQQQAPGGAVAAQSRPQCPATACPTSSIAPAPPVTIAFMPKVTPPPIASFCR